MSRSDRQRDASRANGQRSQGPTTEAGKARSAQNARSHGLTGKLEANPDEAAYLQNLWARLSERFDPADAYQGQLMQIALNSELRMLRAHALLKDEVAAMLGPAHSKLAQDRAKAVKMTSEIQATLIEMTGDKRMGITIPRLIAELENSVVLSRHLPKTRMSTLVRYAQRFRGQRDRALKRLEASRK